MDPWLCRLFLGTWTVSSLEGKEPELVWEVEGYQPETAGLTSMQWVWNQTLEEGVSFSRDVQADCRCLNSLCNRVTWENDSDCPYAPKSSLEAFLESLGGILERMLPRA